MASIRYCIEIDRGANGWIEINRATGGRADKLIAKYEAEGYRVRKVEVR